MGFWGFVSSCVSSAVSFVSSAVSSVVSAVSSVGSAIISATRSTVSYLAEKAKSWGSILKETLKGAVVGGVKGFANGGWKGALVGAVKGGFVAGAKEYNRQFNMPEEEVEEKQERKKQAPVEMEHDPEVERLATLIQDFIPALQRKFASTAPVESFEEYLRIDVSMSFIRDLVGKISTMENPSELTSSDRRFIVLIDKLVMDKPMTEADLQEFDSLVKQRYKKSLLLMGSERLFTLWTNEEEVCKQSVNVQRNDLTRTDLRLKELEGRERYSNTNLTAEERGEIIEKKMHLKKVKNDYEQAKSYLNNIRIVTGVSEGLLQQAEADNAGRQLRERDRARNDRAGAILVNLESNLEEIRNTGELHLDEQQEAFLLQYVDLYMTDAVQRKNTLASEYVEITV